MRSVISIPASVPEPDRSSSAGEKIMADELASYDAGDGDNK